SDIIVPETVEFLRRRGGTSPLAIVSDEHVGPVYAATLAVACREAFGDRAVVMVSVPAGERSKSLAQLGRLYEAFAQGALDRTSIVLAVGGGVVGDLAGLAAATYLRGIDLAQVPTSLLAQVDASIGGKTAVDLPEGKNLVGAFHQPRLVVADLATLVGLPEAQYRSGLAEVIKYG